MTRRKDGSWGEGDVPSTWLQPGQMIGTLERAWLEVERAWWGTLSPTERVAMERKRAAWRRRHRGD